MTLEEIMNDDVETVFLNTDEFAKEIDWLPLHNEANRTTILGVFIQDRLEGTREVMGDGVVLHLEEGQRIRESGTLETSSEYSFNAPIGDGSRLQDAFEIDGEKWLLKRIMGRDKGGMQALRLVKAKENVVRRGTKRG